MSTNMDNMKAPAAWRLPCWKTILHSSAKAYQCTLPFFGMGVKVDFVDWQCTDISSDNFTYKLSTWPNDQWFYLMPPKGWAQFSTDCPTFHHHENEALPWHLLLKWGINQAHRPWGQEAFPYTNSPKLYIEVLYTVLFISIDIYPV